MAAMLRRTLQGASNLVWRSRASGMRNTLRLLARVGVEPATIADVGASDGRWSQLARATFPAAEQVLFEPHPVHAPALERFKVENPDSRFIPSAVGGAEGESLFDGRDPWGGVLQEDRTHGSITVSVVTLDDALATAKPPFLVKLDTHGVEAAILAGAEQTMTRSVAWIIEAYNQRITPDCLLFWELCGFMAEHGFRPFDLVDVHHRPHDKTLWQMDLSFVRSDWAGFSYLGYT
jgi:FkbM family methyltransferase